MSERNEFDELARRKLEVREFPFHEADWLEAQRLIERQRPARAWRTWLYVGVGLLLVGGGAWVLTADSSPEQLAASTSVAARTAVSSTSASALPPRGKDAPRIARPDQASEWKDVPQTPGNSSEASTATNTATFGSNASRSVEAPALSTAAQDKGTSIGGSALTTTVGGPTALGTADARVASEPDELGPNTTAAVVSSATSPEVLPVLPSGPATQGIDPVAVVPEQENDGPVVASRVGSEQVFPNDPTAPSSAAEPAAVQHGSAAEQPSVPTDGHTLADTTMAAPATSPVQDSANATPAPAVVPPPLITPDSPWELSMLFGGLLSNSTYTGGNSAEWMDGQTGRWSPAFGGEVMHMGRNFGIGSGLHYSTYAEDLRIAERTLTTTVVEDSNYFEPQLLSILHVLGTQEINGQLYYVTEVRDTTIDVLVLGTTTRTSTRKLIDARDLANRVSYLEVPLLLDAHLVQGAWAIGLRGGPTMGLLNERRGALPNATFDGYTDLSTQQFRSPVFGMTARAYVRYRFHNGWSVGLEPMWRTHFGNAVKGSELLRRSTGIGGMMSVSYRLR